MAGSVFDDRAGPLLPLDVVTGVETLSLHAIWRGIKSCRASGRPRFGACEQKRTSTCRRNDTSRKCPPECFAKNAGVFWRDVYLRTKAGLHNLSVSTQLHYVRDPLK